MADHQADDANDVYMSNISQTVSEDDEEEVHEEDSMIVMEDAALDRVYHQHMR